MHVKITLILGGNVCEGCRGVQGPSVDAQGVSCQATYPPPTPLLPTAGFHILILLNKTMFYLTQLFIKLRKER